ncbi:Histidine kinase-, DNA gyrase B-, and HSP90-like ATPase [compost metagenome]
MHIEIEGGWNDHGEIVIRITDDGAGMSKEKLEELLARLEHVELDKYKLEDGDNKSEISGLGLINIAERIKLHYGDQYYLTIRSGMDRGTIVEICIPKRLG